MWDWFQIFQVAQTVAMALAAVFAWFWGKSSKAESDLLNARFKRIDERFLEMEQDTDARFNRIDAGTSKLSSRTQELIEKVVRMPEEMRKLFLSLDRAADFVDESRKDRAALWDELRRHGLRNPRNR